MRHFIAAIYLLVTISLCCASFSYQTLDASHFGPPHKLHSPIAQSVLFSTGKKPPIIEAGIPVIYPTDFGADPFGKSDSFPAFAACLKELLSSRGANTTLANGIIDLGGAVLDLAGGDYLISQPIAIPVQYGNFLIQRGSLRATSDFPSSHYLIEVGGINCQNSQGACNENFGITDLMLDAQRVASGGILVGQTMGASIGPRVFVLGFTVAGINVIGGHEVMIHESWMGEYLYSDPRSHNKTFLTGVGIVLAGNDHFITNTIVFSALIGVNITGAANLITGVHTWNLVEDDGGIGILVDAPGYTQNRLVGCYLDYNDIVAIDPEHLTIVDGFFLCGGNIILRALTSGHVVQGLVVADNQFDGCGDQSIILDQSQATFSAVVDTFIVDNMYANGYKIIGTSAVGQVTAESSSFVFNFTEYLLFPFIKKVQYSVQINTPGVFVQHASRPPTGLIVIVETSQKVNATVTVSVDQSVPSAQECC
eukprot:Phypoly_transcript_07826.p1 GENE.Phypoly_transcript_07826~~Phypoly_transcript_07826.p1  ORF type:complete len:480 (+),score=49.66 Phypoly_transcript_07826:140-1579(+)